MSTISGRSGGPVRSLMRQRSSREWGRAMWLFREVEAEPREASHSVSRKLNIIGRLRLLQQAK